MPGLVPPARPKPLRRGEGPGIHVLRAAWPAVMAGTKASGSDAVLRTAMPGHDAVEVLAPDLSAQMRWLRPQTASDSRPGRKDPG
ncbi:hypothetical protein M2171_009053 [Bradyrhizobium japonicum USDA 38]|nr:hypothetical protein [Bradyrhizobium japonicum USDA 38]MCS3942974.1 hypothetical protein [Bradyrhizobium japonicum]